MASTKSKATGTCTLSKSYRSPQGAWFMDVQSSGGFTDADVASRADAINRQVPAYLVKSPEVATHCSEESTK